MTFLWSFFTGIWDLNRALNVLDATDYVEAVRRVSVEGGGCRVSSAEFLFGRHDSNPVIFGSRRKVEAA